LYRPNWWFITSTQQLSQVFSSFDDPPYQVADNAIAWGSFQDSISSTGWGILNLQSSSAHSDYLQAAALGFLEGTIRVVTRHYSIILDDRANEIVGWFSIHSGVLTRTRIAQMWESVKYLHGRVANMDFLGKHNDYIRSQVPPVKC
jgi:hypothetical protein